MPAPSTSPPRREPTQLLIDAGSHTLAAHDYGDDHATGAPVLFVHATGFHGRTWGRVIDFMPQSVRCVALDVRAHGSSSVADDDTMAWAGFADDVGIVVRALGLDNGPLHGVGHSAGATALVLAQLDGLASFDRLWLYEPVIFPTGWGEVGANPLAASARRRRATFESSAAARSNFASKPPMSNFDPTVLDDYLAGGLRALSDHTVTLACDPEREAMTYDNGPLHDAYSRLAELRVPVALVRGSRSETMWQAVTEMQARLLQQVSLQDFPGSGHFGPMEQPQRIAESIITNLDVASAESETA